MDARRYRVEQLARHHARDTLSCGEDSLDRYLRQRARQDADRHVATVFVLEDEREHRIAGYYTLSAASVRLEDLPPEIQRGLPRYPLAPVILLGRLAIDQDYQDRGLGGVLLFNALRRAFKAGTRQVATIAVIVDALHDGARGFYERYDFRRMPDDEYRLILPMGTIAQLLEDDDAAPV